MQEELQKLIQRTEEGIRHLPKPPSQDYLGEILHLISDFVRDLGTCLEGTPDAGGLLQTIRPHQEKFRHAIQATSPDFRPTTRPKKVKAIPPESAFTFSASPSDSEDSESTKTSTISGLEFLANEEETVWAPQDDARAIYIDEVMKRASR